MADLNPYAAPQSDLTLQKTGALLELTEPRRVAAGRGWAWIAGGFELFKRDPAIWIVNILIFIVITIALSFIPFIGQLAGYILNPIFAGGLMLGCYAEDRGEPLTVAHLFAGFQQNTGTLAAVGGLYVAGLFGLLILFMVLMMLGGVGPLTWWEFMMQETGNQPDPQVMEQMGVAMLSGGLIALLVVVSLSILLVMALWFAPVLVVMHSLTATEAMRLSFTGCKRNVLPFLVFGLVALLLVFVGALPMGLGLLIVLPMLTAATYVAYKDIFVAGSA